jgi:carbamoyl-phosphate synthase large subunit
MVAGQHDDRVGVARALLHRPQHEPADHGDPNDDEDEDDEEDEEDEAAHRRIYTLPRMPTVLFTCSGMRVDIVTAFREAGATTIAVDVDRYAPTLYRADRYALVGRIEEDGYVSSLRDLVRAHDVDVIVPLADMDQLKLARARDELEALVLLPDADVVDRMADKYAAHGLFEELGFDSPATYLPGEVPDDLEFPVLVKARRGYGSRHIYRAHDREALELELERTPVESMVQAVCPGAEFSIDVVCDLDGRCLNAIPRTMIESKGGESIKGMTVKDWELIELARRLSEAIPLKGVATIQCFRGPDGKHRITDVNPRFGGAFPLPQAAGGRYPELVLALAAGERPEPRVGEFRAGVVMTRFLSHLCLTAAPDGTLEPFSEELSEESVPPRSLQP